MVYWPSKKRRVNIEVSDSPLLAREPGARVPLKEVGLRKDRRRHQSLLLSTNGPRMECTEMALFLTRFHPAKKLIEPKCVKSFINAHFQTITENVTLKVPLGLDTWNISFIRPRVLVENTDSEVGRKAKQSTDWKGLSPWLLPVGLALERYWYRS